MTIEEILDDKDLFASEKKLKDSLQNGGVCDLGEARPESYDEKYSIRPEIIRALLTAETNGQRDYTRQFYLKGAWIGTKNGKGNNLDLEACDIRVNVVFENCTFPGEVNFADAKTRSLSFINSEFQEEANFDRIDIDGEIFFKGEFQCNKLISMRSAHIQGTIYIHDSSFKRIDLINAVIKKEFSFLRSKCTEESNNAKPPLDLTNAKIGSLQIDHGTLGNNDNDTGLSLAGKVKMENMTFEAYSIQGDPVKTEIFLKQFLAFQWRRTPEGNGESQEIFDPQPYENIANALRRSGARGEANEVLIKKNFRSNEERKRRFEESKGNAESKTLLGPLVLWIFIVIVLLMIILPWTGSFEYILTKAVSGVFLIICTIYIVKDTKNWRIYVKEYLARASDLLKRKFVGYGYKPQRAIQWIIGMNTAMAIFYSFSAINGSMTPTHPLIYLNKELVDCRSNWTMNSIEAKEKCAALMPPEYSPFNPLVYSFDVGIPLVEFGQEADWSPRTTIYHSTKKGEPKTAFETDYFGEFVRVLMYLQIIMGWVLSLLFVSAVSGVIRRE